MSGFRVGSGTSPEVAVHLQAAGSVADPLEAAEWSLRAAQEASAVYAWDEAIQHADAAADLLQGNASDERLAEVAVVAANLRLRSSRGFDQAVTLLETALRRYLAAGMDSAAGTVHSRIGGALSLHHSVMDIPRALEHFEAAERLLGDSDRAFHVNRGRSQAAMFGLRTDVLGAAADKAASIAAEMGRRDLAVFAGWAQAWAAVNEGTSHRCGRASRALVGHGARAERPLSGLGAGQRRGPGGKRVPARPWDGATLVPPRSGTAAVHVVRSQPRHGHRPARPGPGCHRRSCRRP